MGGLAINFILPENPDQAVVEITDYLHSLLDQARTRHPDIDYYLTGDVVMNRAFSDATTNDMQTLTPIVFLIIVVATVILLRSILGIVAIVAVLMFVINTTMGFAGWNGVVFSPTSAGVPIIVLVIAVADSIHIVTSVLLGMRRGLDRNSAIVESFRINAYPVFLTSVTTAIGFLSLNASDSPPFHDLGNYVAFGVLCAFFYSMTLLPVLLSILPLRVSLVPSERTVFFDRFADFVIARRTFLLWSLTLVVVVLITGIPRIELSDNWVRYFDERYEFRRHTDFVVENLTGLNALEYSLKAGREGGITDPDYLRKVDAFAEWYREQPEVTHVQALPDIMKRLNKNMHGDDPAFYRLPDDPELAAQYLLLYELSLPFGSDLNDRIDVAKSATRVTVVVRSSSAWEQRELAARAQAWLRANVPDIATEASGISVIFAHISQRNINSMLRGTIFAMVSNFVHPDVGFQERSDWTPQSCPQFHPCTHELRPVGVSRRLCGHCLLGGHRRCLRDCRGRYDSFSQQISEGPPRGPSGARGCAFRLSYRGPGVMDYDRSLVGRLSGIRRIGIRGELGTRSFGHDHDHLCACCRFFAPPDSADCHRPEKIMNPALSPARTVLPFFALCLIILTCLGVPTPAHSESATAEETGLKIATEGPLTRGGFRQLYGPTDHGPAQQTWAREPAPAPDKGSRGPRRR